MNVTLPGDIERRSMEIITQELLTRGIHLPEEQSDVVRRVIHTTADFDYAHSLHFTEGAVEQAVTALRAGASIVTDTNMARAGISANTLESLGGDLYCYMADNQVAQRAKGEGTTRAVASMRFACSRHPCAMFAIGNAPTALFELAAQLEAADSFRPALIIGVPVGFVNVEESKHLILDRCKAMQIPAIVALGRKGGSTVATAICNALLYKAANRTDPTARGW